MLDIRYIRANPEVVAEKSNQKGYKVDIQQLLGFDKERQSLQLRLDELRASRNQLADSIKNSTPSEEEVSQGRELKEKIVSLEHQYNAIDLEFQSLWKQIPNMPLSDVPIGNSEKDNLISKEWGDKPNFAFEPKTHWQIAEQIGRASCRNLLFWFCPLHLLKLRCLKPWIGLNRKMIGIKSVRFRIIYGFRAALNILLGQCIKTKP
jgi:seryl-tRNA synthetase